MKDEVRNETGSCRLATNTAFPFLLTALPIRLSLPRPCYLPRHSIHIFSFIAIFQTFFSLVVGAGGIYLHWNMISEDGEKESDEDDDDNSDDENENATENEDCSKTESHKVRLIL